MKLNVSNLLDQNSRDSAANNANVTTFALNGLGNLQTMVAQNTNTTFTNNADSNAASEERAFTLSFTDGATYNLDDIIYKKRRDNADCPLIVNVQDNDPNDDAVIGQITKLILSDYGIAYTNENYKEQVAYVPLFESVFTNYFNTYYEIFNKQRTQLYEGSISLTSVLEEIVSYHESLVNAMVGENTRTYANTESYNKPKIEWEYGTVYDNALSEDIESFLPDVVNLFALKVVDGKLVITYDSIVIPDSGIDFSGVIGGNTNTQDSRIESTPIFVNYPVDVAPYEMFQPVGIVKFAKLITNLFTATTVQYDGVGEV